MPPEPDLYEGDAPREPYPYGAVGTPRQLLGWAAVAVLAGALMLAGSVETCAFTRDRGIEGLGALLGLAGFVILLIGLWTGAAGLVDLAQRNGAGRDD